MLLKIVSVDENGFVGRQFHPSKSDEGQIVSAIGMVAMLVEGEQDFHDVLDEDGLLISPAASTQEAAHYEIIEEETDGVFIRVWQCLTKTGLRLDLMDHEVELFKS